ncbi:hypothetical protein [Wolbachia endosymbiont of Zygogramma bicolorata]|uniref:hypothetical protein n=1 Tax=Wolbachia endosymbiont of Zygogramma bicolorata TaxID=3134048 RepID=UPI003DA80AF6
MTVGVGFGIANVGLSTLVIAGIAATLVVGIVAFGITYAVSRPSDKLNETYSRRHLPNQLDHLSSLDNRWIRVIGKLKLLKK